MTEDSTQKKKTDHHAPERKAQKQKTPEQLARIATLIAHGDISLLSEIADNQISNIVQIVRIERRKQLLELIAKVISQDLAPLSR